MHLSHAHYRRPAHMLAPLLAALLLAACGGANPNQPGGLTPVSPVADGTAPKNCDELLTKKVQAPLAFCRTCHIPSGIGDVEDGRDFMLSSNSAEDMVKLKAAWETLGRNNPTSRILLMASGQDPKKHTGGSPWPKNSAAYADMAHLLEGFVDPKACLTANDTGVPLPAEQSLLGSKHARHVWQSFCEGGSGQAAMPDNAALPADPRTLIRPGVNANRAVFYNGWWEDCHANLPVAEQSPLTCGDFRTRRDRGLAFLMDELPIEGSTATAYDDSWKKWGLSTRPANFEQLYTLRYGLNQSPFHNPYPLAGEDPNATNGGSGNLPLGQRQSKDANGKWTGGISTAACFQCHGGQIGDATAGDPQIITMKNLGLGNNNFDVPQNAQDGSPTAGTPLGATTPAMDVNSLFNIGIKQRGQNNAVAAFEVLITLLDLDSLGFSPNVAKLAISSSPQDAAHPMAHTQDTPPWWNMGSRPRKFFDSGVSNDSTRIIMAAGPGELTDLVSLDGKSYRNRIEKYDQDLESFFLSLESPVFPGAIDTALAEQGAVLFHSKDLWADGLGNTGPKPLGGNGSCASCHGAYSPRFVNDPAYLQDPRLEGVASHISPLDVIGTDRARADMLTPTLRRGWDSTYWGYPDNLPGYVAPEDKDLVTELADDLSQTRIAGVCGWEKTVIGYQAPPLYGTWATAPYLHNGSVPTIEALLDSSLRKPIWQRQLQTVDGITGFDQRLSAYDFSALGWKHQALACADIAGSYVFNCNPVNDQGPSATQIVQNLLAGLGYAGIVPLQDPTPGALDRRLVYDTRTLGNGNGGHVFGDVLTAAERRAVIEYLKTL